jgi:hypothetical protein
MNKLYEPSQEEVIRALLELQSAYAKTVTSITELGVECPTNSN